METKDWVTMGSAGVAVVFGTLAALSTYINRQITIGQAETALRAAIRATRDSVRQIAIKIAEAQFVIMSSKEEKNLCEEKLKVFGKAYAEAVEENLNAYEDACGKYLDKKIDKDRFKRMYYSEIENIGRAPQESTIGKF